MTERIGRRRIYLDSMVFIYAVEGDATTGPPARDLLACLREHPGAALTSELSLAEVLAPTKFRGKAPQRLRELYLSLLVADGCIELRGVSREILMATADIRPVGMKLPDAIHLATAIESSCEYVATRDFGLNVPNQLIKVTPDAAGVRRIREALA